MLSSRLSIIMRLRSSWPSSEPGSAARRHAVEMHRHALPGPTRSSRARPSGCPAAPETPVSRANRSSLATPNNPSPPFTGEGEAQPPTLTLPRSRGREWVGARRVSWVSPASGRSRLPPSHPDPLRPQGRRGRNLGQTTPSSRRRFSSCLINAVVFAQQGRRVPAEHWRAGHLGRRIRQFDRAADGRGAARGSRCRGSCRAPSNTGRPGLRRRPGRRRTARRLRPNPHYFVVALARPLLDDRM